MNWAEQQNREDAEANQHFVQPPDVEEGIRAVRLYERRYRLLLRVERNRGTQTPAQAHCLEQWDYAIDRLRDAVEQEDAKRTIEQNLEAAWLARSRELGPGGYQHGNGR